MINKGILRNKGVKKNIAIVLAGVCVFSLSGCGSGAGKNYDTGMEYFEAGEYEEACDSFTDAIAINPDKAEYYLA